VLLAGLMLLVGSAIAIAANLSTGNNNVTIFGTTGNDTITAGNGNDHIWGLGGTDSISVGYGNDVIDAGGACNPPQMNTIINVTPPNYQDNYCQHGPNTAYCSAGKGTSISLNGGGGNGGNSVVYTNCGPNTVTASKGMGNYTYYGYGGPNTFNLGSHNGNDTLTLYDTTGASTVTTGTGNDVVLAQNGVIDTITCGSKSTTVYADKSDLTSSKCTVKYTPPPARDSARGYRVAAHRKHRRSVAHRRHTSRRHHSRRRTHSR
jgi:hypothetical protein